MRECIRCGTNMVTSCKDKKGRVKPLGVYSYDGSAPTDLYVETNDGWIKKTFYEKVQVAVCPNCGELSMYINTNGIKE